MNFLRKPLLPNRGISELSYPRSNLSLGATELYALGMAPHLNNTHIKVAHCKTAISTVPKADPPSDSRSKSHPKQRTAATQCWQQSFVWLPHCLFLPPHTAETAGPCPTSSTEDIGHEVYLSTETHQQPAVHMCAKSLLTHASTNTRCTFRHRWSFLHALRESLAAPLHAAARIPVLLIPRAAMYMTPWMQQL